jgi:large subunit ribosomal protein L19
MEESQMDTQPQPSIVKHNFNVGDKVVVNYKIKEGEKFRVQPFEGLVIAMKGAGASKTFTVRRIGAGAIGVERIFPIFSPNIESVKVAVKGRVRRAKLYYLRDKIGKKATKVKIALAQI